MKFCKKCDTLKSDDEFHNKKSSKDGLERLCKICKNEENVKWRVLNKEKTRKSAKLWGLKNKERRRAHWMKWQKNNKRKIRSMHLKSSYGITIETYDIMFLNQSGTCAICGVPYEKLNIDHNHISGKVRGLLCGPCNLGLGSLKADSGTAILQKAIAYLSKNE